MNHNSESESRFNELVALVREQVGNYDTPVTSDTLIENDLGVTGDDAYDLIVAISKKYNVDIKDFMFRKYFDDEPSLIDTSRQISPFTIGHLEKAIIAGKLNEEVINGIQ
jgi:acyl carrier protein